MVEIKIDTLYGTITGIDNCIYYADGKIYECFISEPNKLNTPYGTLVPQYDDSSVRRKNNNSISFYTNGNLKSISLQEQTHIKTPIGTIPAEYITFYESGEIKRIFPLNGKLSGYWSEEEEGELTENIDFSFSFATFSKKVISIQFYRSGKIKSLSLWPGEKVKLQTSQGMINVRTGISLYENGALKSIEPSAPTIISTPIGDITSFDLSPLGVNGDVNSLVFFEDSSIKSILTYSSKVEVMNSDKEIFIYEPSTNTCCEEIKESKPLKIDFEKDMVIFNSKDSYTLENNKYITSKITRKINFACSSCNSCT